MLTFQGSSQTQIPNQNNSPIPRTIYNFKSPISGHFESDDQQSLSRQSTFSPLGKKDLFSTPLRSDTASTVDLRVYSKDISETSRDNDNNKKSILSPQGINNFSDDEMDEFSEGVGLDFHRKSISEKVATTIHLPKKSMGDISARIDLRSLSAKPLSFIQNSHVQMSYRRVQTGIPVCEEFHPSSYIAINEQPKYMFNATMPVHTSSFAYESYSAPKSSRFGDRKSEKVRMVFTDFEFLEAILKYCDFKSIVLMSNLLVEFRNNKLYKKVFNKRLFEFFSQGLERRDQIFYWNSILNFRSLKNDHPFAFSQHFAKRCAYLSDITKDLDRTLPEYEKFSTGEGKSALLSVLVALSNTIKDVGYIQGLNSIAGVFLFYLKEEESFWIMMYFMEKLRFKELLKEDFNRVRILEFQVQVYLDNYVPAIANYLSKNQMSVSYFTTPWFLTLFSYNFKMSNVLKNLEFLI